LQKALFIGEEERMLKKLKFKPVITRVKLNPEQAVLTCPGYAYGWDAESYGPSWHAAACWHTGWKSIDGANSLWGGISS